MLQISKKFFSVFIVFLTLGTGLKWLIGNNNSPGSIYTANCASCHSGGGYTPTVTLTSYPAEYIPNQSYSITIEVGGGVKHGFRLNASAGSFTAGTGSSASGANIVQAGGIVSNPASWTFTWTAPGAGNGTVTFSGWGNATNNNGATSGDNVVTGSWSSSEATAPSNVIFTEVTVASLTVTWDLRTGNSYVMALSPVSDFSSITSSGTGALNQNTTTYLSLSPNTTYFFKVKISTHPDALYSTAVSTLTLPRSPSLVNFQTFSTSISVTLDPSGNQTGTTLSITTGTFEVSTSSSGASASGNTTLALFNLSPNTTYTIQTRAVGFTNLASSATVIITTSTLAEPPDFLTFFSSEVVLSSITIRWNQKSNPVTTRYKIESSTNSDFSGTVTSSTTFTLFLTTTNLLPNTTIYFRGTAINNNNLPSTFINSKATATLSNPPSSPASTFTFVSVSQITAQWDANGNPNGTTYIAEVSTVSNFLSGTITSSATFLLSLTTSGLISNTTYYFRVKARNFNGIDTDFVMMGSTKTLAITDTTPPANISDLTALTGTLDGQIRLQWTSSGDDGDTGNLDNAQIRIHASTSNFIFFSSTHSSTQFGAFDFDTTFATTSVPPGTKVGTILNGLYPGTTWYVAVLIKDDNDNWNFWRKTGTFNQLSSAPAQDLENSAPTGILASAVSSTAITIQWTNPSAPTGFDDRDKYRLYVATSSFTSGQDTWVKLSSEVNHPLTQATTAQLLPNTTYFFRVSALDSGDKGDGRYSVAFESISVLYSTVTAPPPPEIPPAPTGFTISAISTNSMTFSWTANSTNEDGFRIVAATGGLFGSVGAGITSFQLSGLSPNQLIQAKVAAFNSAGASTSAITLSSYALANPPANFSFVSVGRTQLTIAWSSNSNPPTVVYELSQSTDNFLFQSGISTPVPFSFNLTSTFTTVGSLTTGGTYYFRVRAQNSQGIPTAFSPTISTTTLALEVIQSTGGTMDAGATTLIADAGIKITIETLSDGNTQQTFLSTQTANAIYGNGLSLELTPGVEVKVIATANSLTLTSTQTVAVKESGVTIEPSSGTISIQTSATALVISVGTNALQNLQTTISAANAKTVSISLNPPTGEIKLELAPATLSENAKVRVKMPENFPSPESSPAVGRGAKGLKIGVEILLDKPIQPKRTVPITVSYRESDISGISPNSLTLSRFDETAQLWTQLPTKLDSSARRVTGFTTHFSKFQLMSVSAASDISAVKVFPNPFLASKGHTEIKFTNLPADTSVKIYTTLGQLVRELSTDSTGRAFWDLKNSAGEEVASDIYLALIEGVGGRKILKMGVQR